jgi:type IV pilus assembly protein PilA
LAVAENFQAGTPLTEMDAPANGGATTGGLPPTPATSTVGALSQIDVVDGVITATPRAYKGILATETCTLTPVAGGERLNWTYSGQCVTAGYVKN